MATITAFVSILAMGIVVLVIINEPAAVRQPARCVPVQVIH